VCVLNGLVVDGGLSNGVIDRVGGCDSLCLKQLLIDTHVMKSSYELFGGLFIVFAGRGL
jgi:hypothetical protein